MIHRSFNQRIRSPRDRVEDDSKAQANMRFCLKMMVSIMISRVVVGIRGWHRDMAWIAPSSQVLCVSGRAAIPSSTSHSSFCALYRPALRENTWFHFDFFSIVHVLISIHKGVDEPHPATSHAQ